MRYNLEGGNAVLKFTSGLLTKLMVSMAATYNIKVDAALDVRYTFPFSLFI